MKAKRLLSSSPACGFLFIVFFAFGCNKESAPERTEPINPGAGANPAGVVNLQMVTDTEVKERDDFKNDIRALVLRSDFQKLEISAGEFRSQKSRFRSGFWKLRTFYLAFEGPPEDTSWPAWLGKLQQWELQYPDSITPQLALASAYCGYALTARGSDWGYKVTDEAAKQMGERLEESFVCLRKAKNLMPKEDDYGFYAIALRDCLWANVDRSTYENLFEAGVRNAPDYSSIYEYKAYYLLPRWYGQAGEWESFARNFSKRKDIPGSEEIFARCAIYLQFLGLFYEEFSYDDRSWEELKASFHAIEKNYPDSLEIKSIDCFMAVRMCDYREARSQMKLLEGRVDLSVWPNKEIFLKTIKWLNNKESVLQQQQQQFEAQHRRH